VLLDSKLRLTIILSKDNLALNKYKVEEILKV